MEVIFLKRRLIEIACPFPNVTNEGILNDGICIKQPPLCLSCGNKTCKNLYGHPPAAKHTECGKGLSIFIAEFEGFRLVINGLLITGHHSKQPRKQKKMLSTQFISEKELEAWYLKSVGLGVEVDHIINDGINSSLGMLHDVKTAVSLIFRNAENLINEELGTSFDEKIENAAFNKKSLFKSVSLLEERLKMTNLLTNPGAASHGQKRSAPIYKIIDKMAKIFYPLAIQRQIRIEIIGTSYNAPYLYESFSTIPLVLIDNAVKYSASNQTVTIRIKDDRHSVKVEIESFSPKIPEDDIPHIFKRNHRGSNASMIASSGSGLGLYLANIVADVNDVIITHSERPSALRINGIDYVTNIFSFVTK